MAASRRLSKGKSTERANAHQDVTLETLTAVLGLPWRRLQRNHGDAYSDSLVRKNAIFTHDTTNLGHDVSEKRFITHNNSKLSGFERGKRFITHDTVKLMMTPYTRNVGSIPWLSEQNVGHTGMSEAQQRAVSRLPYTKTRKENHSPTLSFMRFQPRTGRMKERRQAESQKMAAGVKS